MESAKQSSKTNQLSDRWAWVDHQVAATHARHGNPLLEDLRKGHGLLNKEQFAAALDKGELNIILIDNCAALIAWGSSIKGVTANILTVCGTLKDWERCLPVLDKALTDADAQVVMSICHPGWERTAKACGYQTNKRLFIMKDLTNDQRSES